MLMDQKGKFDSMGPNPLGPNKSPTSLLQEGIVEIDIKNVKYLEAVTQMVEPFHRILAAGFRWSIIKSPRNRVVLSDHPLTYLHPGEHPGAYGIPPRGKSCEMAFPLSKGIYILGLWEHEVDDVESEDAVDELNKRQAIFASRHIASCHDKKTWHKLAVRFKHHGFQTLAERVAEYHILRAGVYLLPGAKSFKGSHPLLKTRNIERLF